jgi:chromosome segregation ATPase
MKKLFIAIMSVALLTSCSNKEQEAEIERLRTENASLLNETTSRDSAINSFMEALNEIEDNLSEVKQKQTSISTTAKGSSEIEGTTKDRINEDILFINDLLEENKKKIANLQSKLKNSNFKIAELEKLIAKMGQQIEEKDAEIEQLKEQLTKMNFQIEELSGTVADLTTQGQVKEKVIAQQTEKLNTAYYAVGTFKELRSNKVLDKEGGFLGIRRSKVVKDDFNQDYFTAIDVSKIKTIPINGKDVKLITNHAPDSYKLETDESKKKYVKSITITNPDRFWKASKYLVVTIEK